MSRLLLLALTTTTLHAAVIRGMAIENQTGKFLARTLIRLQPLGPSHSVRTIRTSISGAFEFSSLPAGGYILRASRAGFLPVEYNQKRWNSAGQPLILEENGTAFLTLRLSRYSAISGTIVDENDIGLPEHDVVAYRATRPPQLATRARSDERGAYRLSGLEPGTYIVRSAGAAYEEGSYIPTFAKEAGTAQDAQLVQVDLDQEAKNVEIRPHLGRLSSLSGAIGTDPLGTQATVTVATDMGRQTVITDNAFQFAGLPPGPYEIYAQAPVGVDTGIKLQGYYLSDNLSRDTARGLNLAPTRDTTFDFRGAPPQALDTSAQLLARRVDLAGTGPAQVIKLANNRVPIPPGRWELMLVPPPGYYVAAFSGSRYRGGNSRPEGWNEVQITGMSSYVSYTLSGSPSTVSGIVKRGSDPAAGAPVYLEAWDPVSRRRTLELRGTVTDQQGRYRFEDLAPGDYRILATFEYLNPDFAAMDAASPDSIRLQEHSTVQHDLTLYEIR